MWTCLVWAERSTPDNCWVRSHRFNPPQVSRKESLRPFILTPSRPVGCLNHCHVLGVAYIGCGVYWINVYWVWHVLGAPLFGRAGNQAYSRLSTTHGHITDCKLDLVVYAGSMACIGHGMYWVWHILDVAYIFWMWHILGVACIGCGIYSAWHILMRHGLGVACIGYGMHWVWHVLNVAYIGRGIYNGSMV